MAVKTNGNNEAASTPLNVYAKLLLARKKVP